jgi:hypothetical protein
MLASVFRSSRDGTGEIAAAGWGVAEVSLGAPAVINPSLDGGEDPP